MKLVALFTAIVFTTQAFAGDGLEASAEKPEMYRFEYAELHSGTHPNGQPILVTMGPGLALNEPASIALARHITGLEAENKSLKESLNAVPPPNVNRWLLVTAVVCGVLLGGAAVAVAKR